MRIFNAFQIVAAFVAWPYLIAFLSDATFRGATIAFWSSIGIYVVACFMMIYSVYETLGKDWS